MGAPWRRFRRRPCSLSESLPVERRHAVSVTHCLTLRVIASEAAPPPLPKWESPPPSASLAACGSRRDRRFGVSGVGCKLEGSYPADRCVWHRRVGGLCEWSHSRVWGGGAGCLGEANARGVWGTYPGLSLLLSSLSHSLTHSLTILHRSVSLQALWAKGGRCLNKECPTPPPPHLGAKFFTMPF